MPALFGPPFSARAPGRNFPVRWWHSRAVLVGAGYFVLHLLAHSAARFFAIGPGISLWYPPAGLALALLVLCGPRFSPVVLAANLAGAWLDGGGVADRAAFLFPLLITGNYTAAAVLVRHLVGPRLLPGSLRETLVFAAGIFLAPMGIALGGTVLATGPGPVAPARLLRDALNWWLGDVSGLLTIAPAAMVFVGPWVRGQPAGRPRVAGEPRRLGLIGAELLALVASIWTVFACDSLPHAQTFYLCLLPLVWACLEHGLPGATLATLAITLGVLVGLRLTDGTMESAAGFLFLELTVAGVGLGLGSAVSRRNAAERRLAANEARLNRITTGSQVGLWEQELQGGRVTYSAYCAELLRCDPVGLAAPAAEWYGNIHPADRPRVERALQEHLEGRTSIFFADYRLPPETGPERWINTRGSVVARDPHRRPLLLSGSLIDITERRRAKLAAERQLQVLEATTDFVLTTDAEGRILYANAALLRFWRRGGLAAVQGLPFAGLLPAECREPLAAIVAALPAAGLRTGELRLGNPAGTVLPVSLVALRHRGADDTPDTFSFVLRDISPQKAAEAERLDQERKLLELQKAESLGVLAGGIAHDFNNLLMAMLGNAELARLELPAGSPLHDPLSQIETAAHRAADLCQQMLAYAGRRPLLDQEVDLGALIEQTQRLFQVSIGKKIVVALALAPEPLTVRAAPPQLQQVILNLVLNAAQAIGDREGRIAIRTAGRAFAAGELQELFGPAAPPAGRYALCEVDDTGHGIPPELRRRIFDPFFTTKATGHGLGLAAVHGVVVSHRGAIAVDSIPGRGATFRFVLPLCARTGAPASGEALPDCSHSGLALIVDDEPGVLSAAARLLQSLGFTTVEAGDGAAAVALFRQHAAALRLVLLDLAMSHPDGVEALGEFQRINPAVPVVLMSGFAGNPNYDQLPAAQPAGPLAKPFTREALQARLAAVLGRR